MASGVAEKPKQRSQAWRFLRKTTRELDWDEHEERLRQPANIAHRSASAPAPKLGYGHGLPFCLQP
jgi:hypothetical protein